MKVGKLTLYKGRFSRAQWLGWDPKCRLTRDFQSKTEVLTNWSQALWEIIDIILSQQQSHQVTTLKGNAIYAQVSKDYVFFGGEKQQSSINWGLASAKIWSIYFQLLPYITLTPNLHVCLTAKRESGSRCWNTSKSISPGSLNSSLLSTSTILNYSAIILIDTDSIENWCDKTSFLAPFHI